mmetsp:Transcript_27947/g.80755  ORF Transcript_27947/g.80755 Transcript_27947/m.80755 type:complete len:307 (-) Transcript_27947:54-974(-)
MYLHVFCLGGQASNARLLCSTAGGHVRAPAGNDLGLLPELELVLGEELGGLDSAGLLHSDHLVANNLAPVGTILVGLDDGDLTVGLVDEKDSLLPGLHAFALGTLHTGVELSVVDQALLQTRIDDGNLLTNELIGTNNKAEGGKSGGIVLNEHAVEHSKDAAAGHVPPGLGVLRDLIDNEESAVVRPPITDVSLVGGVELITGRGLVNLEELLVGVGNVSVGVDADLVGVIAVRDGGVEADLTPVLVIDGADLESLLVASDHAGLLPTVARGTGAHDGGLNKDARATVGVGTILGVDGADIVDIVF